MKSIRLAWFAVLLVLVPMLVFAQDKADVKTMKYADLARLIRDNKGKVIVVDVWFFECTECKKAMPHLVEMQRKYARDGLLAVTVNVDEEKEQKDKAIKFLQQTPIPVVNVLLDENQEVSTKKLQVDSFPTVFVFNRAGKYVRFPSEEKLFTYKDVEKVAVDFLNEK